MITRRSGLALGLSVSLLAHGGLYLMLRWAGELPDVGIELTLPSEMEFGVADGALLPSGDLGTAAAPAEATTPTTTADAVAAPPAPPDAPAPKPKPKKPKVKPMPKAPDAGVDDADTRENASKEAPKPAGGAEGTGPQLAAYAPPGAQLALRLDMDRVRASPLAADASQLLAAIPDVGMILDGSGVDPLADLSRLFIASPNLQRSSFVLAGSYVGDEDVPKRAVESLARARGKTAKWSRRGGIRVAPWENADETPRVLALLSPSLFAITRPDDLPRIIAVARALAARRAKPGTEPAPDDAGEALLAMEPDEVVAFSVENAKSFAHGNAAQVPDRLTLSIRAKEKDDIHIISTGVYESEGAAQSALSFWQKVQTKFARHPLVALVGLSGPLRDTTLVVEGTQLIARTTLSLDQAQRILAFARDMLASGQTRRGTSPGKSAEPSPPAPAVQELPEQ